MITVNDKEQNIKICSKCKISSPHYKNASQCKSCQGKYRKDSVAIRYPYTEDHIKVCTKCKEEKLHSPRGGWCKDCWKVHKKEYANKNYEEIKARDTAKRKKQLEQDPLYFRKLAYKRLYNITLEDYDLMLKYQNYSCAICKSDSPGGQNINFLVDHCHITGRVRGLLCALCNFGVGAFSDSSVQLNSAIEYLKNPTYENYRTTSQCNQVTD